MNHFTTSIQHLKTESAFYPVTVFTEIGTGRATWANGILSQVQVAQVLNHAEQIVNECYSEIERVRIALENLNL